MTELTVRNAFSPEDVDNAVELAIESVLLCDNCMENIATLLATSQSDFCPSCQDAVRSQLVAMLEGRMKELLDEEGLPEDSIQIAGKGNN